jgi:DNA polymerase-3 subunit epsilon
LEKKEFFLSKKEFVFDVETGGLDSEKNPLLTLAGIIVIDGKIVETFDFKIKPFVDQIISEEALAINGLTQEQIDGFEEPMVVYSKLEAMLGRYKWKWNKDKSEYFKPIGYNVGFDLNFLVEFFRRCGDKYLFCYLKPAQYVDYWKVAVFLNHIGLIPDLENYKLTTVCDYFGIELKPHDALEDIKATYLLGLKLKKLVYDCGKQGV